MPPDGWGLGRGQGRGEEKLQGDTTIHQSLEGEGDEATASAKSQMPDVLGRVSSLAAGLASHREQPEKRGFKNATSVWGRW